MIEDRVSIRLNGDELQRSRGYDVQIGLLTQPSRFAIRLGHSGLVRDILEKYPPGTACQVFVDTDTEQPIQFTGVVDARNAVGPNASVILRGRDALGQMHSSYAVADKSYANRTYHDLVEEVLFDCGTPHGFTLLFDGVADIKAKTGDSKVTPTRTVHTTGFIKKTSRIVVHPPLIKAGERYYEFLKRILDRQGMFLMATSQGNFILVEPDPTADPIYQIYNVRRDGSPPGDREPGTVINFDFDDDTTERFSKCVVLARGTGVSYGRDSIADEFVDEEMTGFRFKRPRCYVDSNVSGPDEAKFLARRRIAESRRVQRFLSYTLAGHTTPTLGSSNRRIVWSRNTMVNVIDEELGIDNEKYYVEHVALFGDETNSHTVVRLMRNKDLVFNDPVE